MQSFFGVERLAVWSLATSAMMYLAEGFQFVLFAVGIMYLCRRLLGRTIARVIPVTVNERTLGWFMGFQVAFLAGWSVVFKCLLPLPFHQHSGPLYRGGSQYYAYGAEILCVFAILVGLWRIILNLVRKHAVNG